MMILAIILPEIFVKIAGKLSILCALNWWKTSLSLTGIASGRFVNTM